MNNKLLDRLFAVTMLIFALIILVLLHVILIYIIVDVEEFGLKLYAITMLCVVTLSDIVCIVFVLYPLDYFKEQEDEQRE